MKQSLRRVGLIAAILAAFIGVQLEAQKLPLLSQGVEAEKAALPSPPQPLNLESGWWNYFSEAGDKLPARVNAMVGLLQGIAKSDTFAKDTEVQDAVSRLTDALHIYPDFIKQTVRAPEALPDVKDSYSWPDVLSFAQSLRSERAQWVAERNELTQSQLAAESQSERIDDLERSYRSSTALSRDRLLLGLNLIFRRLAQAVEQHRTLILKESSAQDEVRIEQLSAQLPKVLRRVRPETQKNSDLSRLKAQEKRARERAYDLEAGVLRTEAKDALSVAQQALRRQESVLAQIDYADARLDLALALIEQGLYALLNRPLEQIEEPAFAAFPQQAGEIVEAVSHQFRYLEQVGEQGIASARDALSLLEEDGKREAEALKAVHKQRLEMAQQNIVRLREVEGKLDVDSMLLSEVEEMGFEQEPSWQQGLSYLWRKTEAVGEGVLSLLRRTLFRIAGSPITISDLVYVIVIIVLAYLLSLTVQKTLKRVGERRPELRQSALYTLGRLSHYVIMALGIVIGLSSINIDFSNIAIVAGALSVGVGFGLQSIINNFVSGIILLSESSLKVGDYVELESGLRGSVKEINVRSTVVSSNDGIDVLVPNSELVSNRVINWTFRDAFRRVTVPFSVAYGTDKDLVLKAVMEAVEAIPVTLRHTKAKEPNLRLAAFGHDGLEFELTVWVNAYASKRYALTQSTYLWEIDNKFRQYGIEVPYPQRDLRLRLDPESIKTLRDLLQK
ncbi:MAG: mechanosensitive ion channel [Chlamydiia bacterium]|nr:mechanosensitive ion channel [Chlamydiia bacterium]